MIILPAIDIKDKQCVRLVKGDYATAHQVAESPYETAKSFKAANASWIHMVDLDGAKERKPVNQEIFERVAKESGLKVEVGGGIRDMKTIEYYLERGIERVILGSVAVKNPELVKEAVKEFKERIAVGIDAKNGMVSARGWLSDSQTDYLSLAEKMDLAGSGWIVFTDISKDGMMEGPNLSQLSQLRKRVSCRLTASGGIRSLEDLKALDATNIEAAILGKALYTGAIDLTEAIRWAGVQREG